MTARKDAAATVLTILVVLAFLATHEAWNVWLLGGSHRWAAAVITQLGMAACAVGTPRAGVATNVCAALGGLALGLASLAMVTGSLTPLSLLVLDIVALWLIATAGHIRHHTPASTI